MPVRLSQDPLQGAGQEHSSVADPVCFEQFVDGEETNFAGDYWMSAPVLWVNAQKQTQRGRKTGIKSVKLTNQRKEISSGEVLSISSRFGGGFADHP